MSSLNDLNLLSDFILVVEAPYPDAVGVSSELVHGLMQVRQEKGEGRDPEVQGSQRGQGQPSPLAQAGGSGSGHVPCEP